MNFRTEQPWFQGTLAPVADGGTAGRGCVCLMVSAVYKKRASPVAWSVIKGKKGHFREELHIELIKRVAEMIPEGTDVIFSGDGEFDGIALLETVNRVRVAKS
ncbi:hypothetical protein QUF90_13415 [Desulfococcaceae bacterium HSG9]|nr:hypothetical protein [Desulfococcaceae bacterium HSG9]